VLAVTALNWPADAHAFAVHFCGDVMFPGAECSYPTKSHWDRVRSRYPGPEAHNVYSCAYMYNYATNQLRGQDQDPNPPAVTCAHTWDTNPLGRNFGVTTLSNYRSFNRYPSYNPTSHTIVGWTSDNQTDG
jgi:hypothetical protein